VDSIPSRSKRELECQLHEARRRGVHHLAKEEAIHIAIHRRETEELRVIEEIEYLQTKLQHFGFGNLKIPQQSQIAVLNISGP